MSKRAGNVVKSILIKKKGGGGELLRASRERKSSHHVVVIQMPAAPVSHCGDKWRETEL